MTPFATPPGGKENEIYELTDLFPPLPLKIKLNVIYSGIFISQIFDSSKECLGHYISMYDTSDTFLRTVNFNLVRIRRHYVYCIRIIKCMFINNDNHSCKLIIYLIFTYLWHKNYSYKFNRLTSVINVYLLYIISKFLLRSKYYR